MVYGGKLMDAWYGVLGFVFVYEAVILLYGHLEFKEG